MFVKDQNEWHAAVVDSNTHRYHELPQGVSEGFDAELGYAVSCASSHRDTSGNARSVDDVSCCLLHQRQKRHRDIDQSKQVDVTLASVVVGRHQFLQSQLQECAGVVHNSPQT